MTCAGWVVEGAEEDTDDNIRPGHRPHRDRGRGRDWGTPCLQRM